MGVTRTERGITLSASLAWSIAVGLISCSIWIGSEIAQMRGAVTTLKTATSIDITTIREALSVAAANRASLDSRLRTVEESGTQTREQISSVKDDVREIREGQKEIINELKGLQREILAQMRP